MAFLNLGFSEVVLIAIVAILVFGKRLPEVATQTFKQVAKVRRGLDDLRRETGIDRELHEVRGAFQDLARQATMPPPYPGGTAWRDKPEPRLVEPEAEAAKPAAALPEPAAEAPGDASAADDSPRPA